MDILIALILILGIIYMFEMFFSKTTFKDLIYNCRFSSEHAYEGDELYLVETIVNKKTIPVPWLKADIRISKWLEVAGMRSIVGQDYRHFTSCFSLKGSQKITRNWKLKCLKRGCFSIESIALVGGGIISGHSVSASVPVNTSIVVYPGIININEYFFPASILMGDVVVKRWILDDPFIVAGVREYTSNDPMNKIHWASTARHGKLMVRKNDYTSDQKIIVFLNVQTIEVEYFGTVEPQLIELGIKTAATIVEMSMKKSVPVGLATNGSTLGGNKKPITTLALSGKEHGATLMEILAKLELVSRINFDKFFEETAKEFTKSDIVLITAYLNDNINTIIRKLKQKDNNVSVFILNRYIDNMKLLEKVPVYFVREEEFLVEREIKDRTA